MVRHKSIEDVTRFFEVNHLPEPLFTVAYKFATLKDELLALLEDDPELTVALRKLVESKDAAVRTMVAQENRRKNNPIEGAPLPRPDHIV